MNETREQKRLTGAGRALRQATRRLHHDPHSLRLQMRYLCARRVWREALEACWFEL